jgi:hypothetical protein
MKHGYLFGVALAGIFACGQLATAQSVIVSPTPLFQQTFTTGMVGFTTNQTARLNVLNLNAVNTAMPTLANCTVGLQFFDGQNNSLKTTVISNFAPQTAVLLDLKRTEVTSSTGSRTEIRGVVVINPTPAAAGAAATGFCNVMTTLEIIDDLTGGTVALTSDTRGIGAPFAMPLSTVAPR